MDRKELLKKILHHLDEAMHLMETTEVKPDDADVVWLAVNEAHSLAETKLNEILVAEADQPRMPRYPTRPTWTDEGNTRCG
jgi:hypothetical protein